MIMDNDRKFLNMLGLCRKAGKLCLGHDAVMDSIARKKAYLVLLSSDSSKRLQRETAITIEKSGKDIRVLFTAFTMKEIGLAVGKISAVLAVTDKNFASRLTELSGRNSINDDKIQST